MSQVGLTDMGSAMSKIRRTGMGTAAAFGPRSGSERFDGLGRAPSASPTGPPAPEGAP